MRACGPRRGRRDPLRALPPACRSAGPESWPEPQHRAPARTVVPAGARSWCSARACLIAAALAACTRVPATRPLASAGEVLLGGAGAPLTIATGGDNVALGWLAPGEGSVAEVRVVRSNDGGRTFSAPLRLPLPRVGSRPKAGAAPESSLEPTAPGVRAAAAPLLFWSSAESMVAIWTARDSAGHVLLASRESAPDSRVFDEPLILGRVAGAQITGSGAIPITAAPRGALQRPGRAGEMPISTWFDGSGGWRELANFAVRGFPHGSSAYASAEGLLVLVHRASPGAPPEITAGPADGTPHSSPLADAGAQTQAPFVGASQDHLVVGTSAAAPAGIALYRSADRGRTWARSAVALPPGLPAARFALAGARVAVAWTETRGDAAAIVLALSRDGGARFGPPRILAPGSAGLRRSAPWIATAGDRVLVAWLERLASTEILRARLSSDGGETFADLGLEEPSPETHDAAPALWAAPSGTGIAWLRTEVGRPGAPAQVSATLLSTFVD